MVCFHIFYCNSARLSNVVRYDEVFVIAGYVITEFHCIMLRDFLCRDTKMSATQNLG